MQGAGPAQKAGRENGGEGGVAAEAHDRVGAEAAYDARRTQNAAQHGEHGGQGLRAAPQKSAHGQTFKGDARTADKILFRAVEAAHEKDVDVGPAFFQSLDDGEGGEDVSAGAAGGDDDAKGHAYSRAVRE